MALSIDVIKVLILVSLLITTFAFGIIPVILIRYIEKASASQPRSLIEDQRRKKSFSKYWRLLSFLNCFAAGVFLATCLLELLPGVRHNLVKVMFSTNIYTGFPMAEFIMVCGLFFILIIEQIALSVKEGSVSSQSAQREDNGTNNDIHQPLLASQPHESEDEQEDERMASVHNDYFLGGISDEPDLSQISDEPEDSNDSRNGQQHIPRVASSHSTNGFLRNSPQDHQSITHSNSPIVHDQSQQKTSAEHHNLHVHSVFRSMFLLFALSLHALFEGLTVGLQTETADILSIFAALVVHKSILSFSLGMNLMQSKISVKSTIKSVILFSVAAPIGLVIGIGIMDLWDTTQSGVVHGILQGVASGTFLYIIFFEILPKEFNSKMDRLLKVLFLITGYGIITGILFLGDDVKNPICLIKRDHN